MRPEIVLIIGLVGFGFFVCLLIRHIIVLSIIKYLHVDEVDAAKSSENKCLGLLISEKFVEKGQLLNYRRLRFLEHLKASNTFPAEYVDRGISCVKEDIEKTHFSDGSWNLHYTNILLNVENDHPMYQGSVELLGEQIKFKFYFNWLLPLVSTPARKPK